MAPMSDNAARVAVLQDYLISHLVQAEKGAAVLIDNAEVVNNNTLNPVDVLAEKAAVSDRTIQKRFRKYVGYSPKELLRFLRFKAVVHFILENKSQKIDWFEIIHTYNYHDQSHLIKDFKYFTGVTPRQFLKLNDEENFCMHTD
jgi:AraC-like DNA-binding protein